jgi:hypothetical protein
VTGLLPVIAQILDIALIGFGSKLEKSRSGGPNCKRYFGYKTRIFIGVENLPIGPLSG